MALADHFQQWAQANIDFVFKLLRFIRPNVTFKGTVLVTRFTDVQEVLSRPNTFGVTYAEKMGIITDGSNFFLGMNDTPIYTQDVSNMRLVARRTDISDRVKPLTETYAQSLVDAVQNGKMDFVKDLSEKVPVHLAAEYMGVPGQSHDSFVNWTTYLFQYLFFPNNPPEEDELAVSYAAEMRTYLDALIQARKEIAAKDDVLGRCLALQRSGTPGMSDVDIRNNLIGILIGAIPTTSKCAAQVLNYLLAHPDRLTVAKKLAQHDDDEGLRKLMLECLRFDPFSPGISRITLEDYTLAKGTMRATKIAQGTAIVAITRSAMMDGREVINPQEFSLERPDYQYMHFGYGLHTCFGYYINMVQIPMILKAVLKRNSLSREPGDAGKMQLRGAFPDHLQIRV